LYEAVFEHYTGVVEEFEQTRAAEREALKNWQVSHEYLFRVHLTVMNKLIEAEIMGQARMK
jgi:hypothetical protein